MFADEARFGRMNRPRPCRARPASDPKWPHSSFANTLYGAVSPKDGMCFYLIMPTSNTACFQTFLNVLSRRFARHDILLVLDGAPNHRCGDLAVPDNISLLFLPPYSAPNSPIVSTVSIPSRRSLRITASSASGQPSGVNFGLQNDKPPARVPASLPQPGARHVRPRSCGSIKARTGSARAAALNGTLAVVPPKASNTSTV